MGQIRTIALAAGIVLIPCGVCAQQSSLEIQKLGDVSYRLTLKSLRSYDVPTAQQEMAAEARKLCAGKGVRWGRYEFQKREAIKPDAPKQPFVLKQDIHCDGEAQLVAPAKPDVTWRPSAEQQQEIERLTLAYFSAKDSASYQQAFAFLSTQQPFDEWRASHEQFNALAGGVLARKISKITWYNNPPQAPPGIYAAADFVSRFENIDIHCGYLVWQQSPGGAFKLIREEQNYIDKKIQQKLSPEQLEATRAKIRCP